MPDQPASSLTRLNRNALLLAIVWTLVAAGSLAVGFRISEHDIRQLALTQARVAFNKDLLYRRWNSRLGGLYAEVRDGLTPNPYLTVPERDITTPGGRPLTMVNPAYMTRMVHEMEAGEDGVRGHLTSLEPLRPENAPDPWEEQALRVFQEGKIREFSEVVRLDGRTYLRYMQSLVTESQCLPCHAEQGYKLGQPRGGLTMAVPLSLFDPLNRSVRGNLALAHLGAWVLGLAGLGLARQRLAARLRERLAAEEALRRHQEHLEEMVASRTRSLAQATEDLKDEVAMRREAQEIQARQNRALWLLKRCDQELIRADREDTLILAMCRLLVEQGGYRLAWVGYRQDDAAKSVRAMASHGQDQGYLESLNLSWDEDSPEGRGPTGRAINTGEPQVSRVEDITYAPWREAASRRGFCASLALPLADQEGAYGVLCLYSGDPEAFDQEECELLGELAGDLAFGINALRAAKQLDQAHAALARAKGSLEDKVARRTQELSETNVRLAAEVERRRLAQDNLTQARLAAEAASRAKSEFLANMSHELRTPMNAILGMTDLALLTSLSPEQRDYLETAKLSAQGLMDLLNDLLDLSKIEAGRLRLEEVDYDLRDLVESTAKSLAVKAHEKNLELTAHVAPDLPIYLRGDPHRLRQVLVNLVGNAIKFTEQGEVAVGVEAQEEGDGGAFLHFSVRDTGIGIPAEMLPRIFERFTQADGSFTRRYGGSGLGTSIAMQLVELMGGRLWAQSELGLGSTFHFTIPLRPGDAPPSAPSLSPERLKGLKVLVADDHPANRRVLCQLFQAWGLTPLEAAEGAAALELARRAAEEGGGLDLAVIDGHMPGMSGLELAHALRAISAYQCLPLVTLTSVDASDLHGWSDLTGPATWISKPVRQRELLEALLRVLGHLEPVCHSAQHPEACPPPTEGRGLRILLAEDNPFNQKLAMALLTRAGHQVALAEDGQAAVELWRLGGVDLVVMDVQMPRMDGLEATRRIRRLELAGEGHVPIVAVTAHAREEDRQRCLQAGMDAYLAKPLQAEEFYATIQALTAKPAASCPPAPAAGQAGGEQPLLDLPRLEGGLGLEREDLVVLCQAFLEDLPGLVEPCRSAWRAGQAEDLRRAAHTIKGVAFNMGAGALGQAARALEDAARLGDQALARPALDRLLVLAEQTSQALTDWLEELPRG